MPPPLKIGTIKWIGYETLYLAQSLQLFDPRAFKLVEMPSSTMVARAFRNESLDVAAGAQNLFDSSKIPGKIIDVLVTRSSVIQQGAAELETLIVAHFSAVRHFYSRDAEAMDIVAAYLGVRQDDVEAQVRVISIPDLQENRRLLQDEPPELQSTVDDLIAMMRQSQLLFLPFDTHNILIGRLLPPHE